VHVEDEPEAAAPFAQQPAFPDPRPLVPRGRSSMKTRAFTLMPWGDKQYVRSVYEEQPSQTRNPSIGRPPLAAGDAGPKSPLTYSTNKKSKSNKKKSTTSLHKLSQRSGSAGLLGMGTQTQTQTLTNTQTQTNTFGKATTFDSSFRRGRTTDLFAVTSPPSKEDLHGALLRGIEYDPRQSPQGQKLINSWTVMAEAAETAMSSLDR
jgi:hypothetical protein